MTDSPPPLTPEGLATWTDQELITEWMRTDRESGDHIGEARATRAPVLLEADS